MRQGTIFTLNARGNIFLEVAQSYLGLSHQQMFGEINGLFRQLLDVLAAKNIKYGNLKNTLIPNPDRNEGVFVFDSSKIESSWYGIEIFEQIIPIFDKRSSHSVLCGDYIGDNKLQDRLFEEFCRNVKPVRHCDYKHSSQFFLVYINNLSDKMVTTFRNNLSRYEPYVSFIDLNFSSFMKTYLSIILCHSFIKHQNDIIMGHEDDWDNDENVNMLGYPFEEHGYVCKSIQSIMYGVFLSYKIERAVFKGFESNTVFSINAITPNVLAITDFDILIEDNKLRYLTINKEGKLKKACLINCDKKEIEKLIREKISSNYIYNLVYLSEYNTIKFNILIEMRARDTGQLIKLTLSLEYKPEEKLLRLITMY